MSDDRVKGTGDNPAPIGVFATFGKGDSKTLIAGPITGAQIAELWQTMQGRYHGYAPMEEWVDVSGPFRRLLARFGLARRKWGCVLRQTRTLG